MACMAEHARGGGGGRSEAEGARGGGGGRSEAEGTRGGGAHGRDHEGRRRRQRSLREAAEATRMVEGGTPSPRPPHCSYRAAVYAGDDSLSPFPSPVLPPPTSVLRPVAADNLNFNDHHKLFSHLPTSDLLHSAAVLHATAVDPLVDFGTWLLRVNGLARSSSPPSATPSTTTFAPDAAAAAKSIRALSRANLPGMLVYSIEDALDNHACDRNFHNFLRTFDVSRSAWSSWRCGWRGGGCGFED
ncbi:LOW QUALITY PROTEIN: hypothetical protein Fmac_024687 [Flemingia macrophylla]|uniref:Proline dehydrogenase n=1 Tax=Flemingia macrophylla TaxID=520843 RepID=A0ABD1LQ31_9FABA